MNAPSSRASSSPISCAVRWDLTGTHVGCEHGVCGACTVLVDGDSMRSCLLFAVQLDGCSIETVESLGTLNNLSPLQEAFREHHALQCGFCTPGMLMTATDLLRKYPLATDEEIRRACRAISAAAPVTSTSSRRCAPQRMRDEMHFPLRRARAHAQGDFHSRMRIAAK
jgi:aerobic-type carbon monoxide dehydrogenase small subunit (CoxS/CutS family)